MFSSVQSALGFCDQKYEYKSASVSVVSGIAFKCEPICAIVYVEESEQVVYSCREINAK